MGRDVNIYEVSYRILLKAKFQFCIPRTKTLYPF
jgi:hypothetical protein